MGPEGRLHKRGTHRGWGLYPPPSCGVYPGRTDWKPEGRQGGVMGSLACMEERVGACLEGRPQGSGAEHGLLHLPSRPLPFL